MTDTTTLTLAEFLLARIAEDEEESSTFHEVDCDLVTRGRVDPAWGWTCTCGHPARVLADCEAKRRIVERAVKWRQTSLSESETDDQYLQGAADSYEDAVVFLALPYADHPEFNEEWKV